jgi:hypothetical protein
MSHFRTVLAGVAGGCGMNIMIRRAPRSDRHRIGFLGPCRPGRWLGDRINQGTQNLSNIMTLRVFSFILLPLLMVNFGGQPHAEMAEKRGTPFSIVSPGILSINDSTDVTVAVETSEKDTYTYHWSTNLGEIKGNDDRAMYYALANKGLATIMLTAIKSDAVFVDSVHILIYKQLILLKADDLSCTKKNDLSANWKRFLSYVEEKNIKASLGLIANSLERGNWQYVQFLRDLSRSDHFEIWNHGYNHLLNGKKRTGETYHEFCNTPFEYQKQHLLKAQNLAKNMLHITLSTFGAPGNAIDTNTILALDDVDDIKVWYFGLDGSSKMVLARSTDIEFPTHHPDFDKFLEDYDATARYLALQIHPHSWDDRRFGEFKKIIDYLIARGVTFIHPHEYYSLITRQRLLTCP